MMEFLFLYIVFGYFFITAAKEKDPSNGFFECFIFWPVIAADMLADYCLKKYKDGE
jgi:hypothetical protein